ncbi:hypothetical protein R5R35_009172 [Gryllus longicercus]|uniref:Serpin domain-containing protein n=1 Tax=Gryllus longicercus TaxID=2509291 RepID=A0AAN9Z1C2_9ORTH
MGGFWSSFFNDEESRKALTDILKCNYSFTQKLYQAISAECEGDVCFAPPLLQHGLASLLAGASEGSFEELARLLQTPADRYLTERGYCALHDHLHGMKDVTLATALRIYTPDTMRLMKDWYITSHKNYSICIKSINVSKPHEELRTSINDWIRSKTKNRIDQLIPDASVNATLQLLLICAAYFRCDLEHPFSAVYTTNDLFYVSEEETRTVKLMHQINTYRYAEFDNLQCQAVEIPYKNPNLRFVMLLPFTVDGLSTFEGHLHEIDFIELLTNMTKTKVLVSVPSFRLQEGYDICDYLEQVGLSTILSHTQRPLTKISQEDPPVTLTQFNHMLFFEFMEDISETASAGLKKPIADPDTVVFRADHPFIFAVIDISLNMILVFGRVNCLTRFTTPVFQKFALDQLEEQKQQYLEDQVQLTADQEVSGDAAIASVSETESEIEIEDGENGNCSSQVRFHSKLVTSSE